jgi:uncharacterized protein involved in copper resistance
MRTLFIASLVVGLSSSAFAQNQPKPEAQQPQLTPQAQKELLERVRADGAAGGTAPVPEDKRKAVGANAGPHRHHIAPGVQRLPSDEPVEPPK